MYSAILSFGIGKWIPTLGAWCRMFVLGLFVVSTVIYAIENGLNLPSGGEFKPSYSLFIALVPVLFFNYVGFELPNAAGDEMEDPQKDVPVTVLRAFVTAVIMYGLPILAILCVLPIDQITGVSGFMEAVAAVFTVYGGAGRAMSTKIGGADIRAFILVVLSCTWLMGSDRAQAVACYDGGGPAVLGRFSAKLGTPVNVNFLSGVLSTIVFIIASNLTTGDAAEVFAAMVGIVLLFTTMSYILIFPCVIKLRYSHPDVPRPYKIPGGMVGVWICGGLCTFWGAFATLVGIFPGFLSNIGDGQILDDTALEDFGLARGPYTLLAVVAIAITLAVGLLFYKLGEGTRNEIAGTSLGDDVVGAPVSAD